LVLGSASVSAYGAAIIAGVAAIIGGVLTAGSNLLIESRRNRQQRQERAERDQRELRQATRLVLAELAEIRNLIERTATSRITWGADRQLPAYAWREYRAILAAHLPLHAWRWVGAAYDEANALNWRVLDMQTESDSRSPVHFIENEWLRRWFRNVHSAMGELERALGDARGAFGFTGYATIEELERGIWDTVRDDSEPGSPER
jgi:hypothetical protein